MKIEIGKKYADKSGRSVLALYRTPPEHRNSVHRAILGVRFANGVDTTCWFSEDGLAWEDSEDLVSEVN